MAPVQKRPSKGRKFSSYSATERKALEETRRNSARRQQAQAWKPKTRQYVNQAFQEWQRFCEELGDDPVSTLKGADAIKFLSFFEWMIETRVTLPHRNTIRTTWKALSMERRRRGSPTPDEVKREVFVFLKAQGYLVRKYGLRVQGRDKPVVGVDDFYDMIHTVWMSTRMQYASGGHFSPNRQRAQLWLFEHKIAYTGARAGAEVDNSCKEDFPMIDEWDAGAEELPLPTYGDCELSLIRSHEGSHDLMVLTWKQTRSKGGQALTRPLQYMFHGNPCLALCPLMSFLTMAFADDAFEAPDFRTPADLLTIKVPPEKRSLQLTFKPEIRDTPLFRGRDGKALTYDAMHRQQVQVGEATGFQQVLTSYCVRRGTANAINGDASTSEQNQILGHHNITMYEQYYQSLKVKYDVQSAFLGLPSQSKLLQSASCMGLTIDQRRPYKLERADVEALEKEPEVRQMRREADLLKSECRSKYRTLKATQCADKELYDRFRQKQAQLASHRKRARRVAKAAKRARFDATQPALDVQRMLQGLPVEVAEQQTNPYAERRRQVCATLFDEKAMVRELGSPADVQRRVTVLSALVDLCRFREPHHRRITEPISKSVSPPPKIDEARNGVNQSVPFASPASRLEASTDPSSPFSSSASTLVAQPSPEVMGGGELAEGDRLPSLDDLFEELIGEGASIDPVGDGALAPPPANLPSPSRESSTLRPDLPKSPTRLDERTCLFCYFDPDLKLHHGCSEAASKYTRKSNMQRHAYLMHFRDLFPGQVPQCPDPACVAEFFATLKALKNHAATVHGSFF